MDYQQGDVLHVFVLAHSRITLEHTGKGRQHMLRCAVYGCTEPTAVQIETLIGQSYRQSRRFVVLLLSPLPLHLPLLPLFPPPPSRTPPSPSREAELRISCVIY